MQRQQRLHGHAAIDYAAALGSTVCKYADPTEDARDDLTLDAARKIAGYDSDLIYFDLDTATASGIADAQDWLECNPCPDQWRAATAPGTLGADEGLFHAMDDEDLEETLGHPRWTDGGEPNEEFVAATERYSLAWAVTVRRALARECKPRRRRNLKRLHGITAIEYAEALTLPLSKYTDPIEGARDGLTPESAREIAAIDGGLIYLELDQATALGVDDAQDWISETETYDELRAAIAPGTLAADEGLLNAHTDDELEQLLGVPRWAGGEQTPEFARALERYNAAWDLTVQRALDE